MDGSVDELCMADSPSRNDWLRYNIVLDAFKLSGISIDFFLQDIIQISGEFEAKHAVLINGQCRDSVPCICAISAQSTYICELATTSQHMF